MTATSESLCGACGHLTSDHETVGEWPDERWVQYGSPCNLCNAEPDKASRNVCGYVCRGYREWPTEPIPHPGTWIAIQLGCKCPVEVNLRRAVESLQPVYTLGCVIHDWVCKQLFECVHDEQVVNHESPHTMCEHCTVPHIECEVCGKVWGDWRTTAEQSGWINLRPETQNLKSVWRCELCQG